MLSVPPQTAGSCSTTVRTFCRKENPPWFLRPGARNAARLCSLIVRFVLNPSGRSPYRGANLAITAGRNCYLVGAARELLTWGGEVSCITKLRFRACLASPPRGQPSEEKHNRGLLGHSFWTASQ